MCICSLVTILVSESSILPTVWGTLYLFAGLMLVTTLLHVYLAMKYTLVLVVPSVYDNIDVIICSYLQDVKDDDAAAASSTETDPLLKENVQIHEHEI
jgi:hypothetical protein